MCLALLLTGSVSCTTKLSAVFEPVPEERLVFCEGGRATNMADRASAGLAMEMPPDKRSSTHQVAQWLFSTESGSGVEAAPEQVKSMSLLKVFGTDLQSSRYDFFEATLGRTEGLKKRYGLIERDSGRARIIRNCEDFNELLASLDHVPLSKPDLISSVRVFVYTIGALEWEDAIVEPIGELDAQEMKALRDWFDSRPGLRLSAPSFERTEKGSVSKFWSWRSRGGLLRRHSITMNSTGKVEQYIEERFGKRVGRMQKI